MLPAKGSKQLVHIPRYLDSEHELARCYRLLTNTSNGSSCYMLRRWDLCPRSSLSRRRARSSLRIKENQLILLTINSAFVTEDTLYRSILLKPTLADKLNFCKSKFLCLHTGNIVHQCPHYYNIFCETDISHL